MMRRLRLFLWITFLCLFASCSVLSRAAGAPRQWKNDWSRGGVFYEVFVRSFQDSNGDGIGDLKGLISKLDYLNDGNPATTTDLQVNALWLMPVFVSPSYHGYDTVDYRHINPDYGTDDDFRLLLQEAHKRGIRIIVDYVMNHTGSDNPWFIDSASSPNSSKRNWYVWNQNNLGWTQPWGGNNPTWHQKNGAYFYGVFWSGMPDLNFRTKAVRTEIKKIAAYWLNQGVDGFRLDATRYLVETGPGSGQADTVETHQFLKSFAKKVRRVKPEAMLVGENWTDTPIIATYFGSTDKIAGGDELPMNFDFPLASAILEALKSGNSSGIVAKIEEIQKVYPPGINDAPFLTNHDMVRVATQLERKDDLLRQAITILMTLPGSPFLYYGEEVGIQNGPADGDEAKRTPMPWNNSTNGGFTTGSAWYQFAPGKENANVASQTSDPRSLLSLYRQLIRLKQSLSALKKGDFIPLSTDNGSAPIFAFLRRSADEQLLVALNLSNSFLTSPAFPVNASALELVFSDGSVPNPSGSAGRWQLTLPPHASAIWRVR
jgi:glycosidase